MPSPVKVTTAANGTVLTGSGETVLDRDRRGTLWMMLRDGSDDIRPWYSKNEGTTWSFAGSPSEIDDILMRDPASFHIDAEGYAHVISRRSNTGLRYSRGTLGSNGVTWAWRHTDFSPSTEAIAPDSGLSLVSFKVGTGWRTWVLSGTRLRDQAGNYTNTLRLTRLDVTSSGAVTVNSTQALRTSTAGSYPHGSLTFQHTGDGKTSTATPHVYVVSAVNTPDTTGQRQDPLQLVKLTYESGSWTTGTPVTLDASVDTTGRTLKTGFDGTRVVTAYGTRNRTTGTSSAAVKVVEWVDAGTITQRNPPSFTGGYPLGTSLAIDPISDDMWLVAYGETNDDPQWIRFNRAAGTWGTWTVLAGASMGGAAGRVSLKTYVSSSAIDLAYQTGTGYPFTVYYIKLSSINRAPSPPSLLQPALSSVTDLGTYGAVFGWQFNDPDPGDTQSAWQMRRKTTAAGSTYTYFNASAGTWGATAVWNVGTATSQSFPAGAWPNGVTYQWSVNTQDSSGVASGFAPDALVTASVSPVVTVVSPLAAYDEDSSPVVTWSYTSPNPQRTYRLRLFDLATYTAGGFDPASSAPVWDSGESASVQTRSLRVGVSLLNGGTYRAYMQVSDSLGIYSQWSYGEFVLILTPAPAPVLEAVPETNYVTGLKRVRLTVQGSTNLLSASQAYDHSNTATDWDLEANVTTAASTAGGATVAGRSLQMTAAAAGDMRVVSSDGVAPLDTTGAPTGQARDFPAAPSQSYTAIASFTASSAPRLCRVTLRFYNAANQLLATVLGDPVADIEAFPTLVSVTGVAPLTTDRVRLVLEVLACPSGDVHYVDRVDLHPGTGTGYSPGGLVPAQTFTIVRTTPWETTSTVVRTADAIAPDANQHLMTYDREMPFGVEVTYQAQAVTVLTSGQGLASDLSGAAVVQVDESVWGMRDPLEENAELRTLVYEQETEILELMSVYRPSGRKRPLVETEGVQGNDGTKLQVWADTVMTRRALRDLLDRPNTLLLQSPAGDSWYVRFTDRKMVAQSGLGQAWELVYVEVDAP